MGVKFLARFAGYLTVNFLLWPVLLLALKLAKKIGHPAVRFLFLVYPGTVDQVRGYTPVWFRNIAPAVSVIGIVRGPYRGLVLTIPYTLEEVEDKNHRFHKMSEIVSQVSRLAETIGARAVALAGRMPGVMIANGYSLDEPFVDGAMGAVYTVTRAVDQAVSESGLDSQTVAIAVLGGYGFIGGRTVAALRNKYAQVYSVDPRGTEGMRDPAILASCDIVVVLTARGEQVDAAIAHAKAGSWWVDDTHPQLPRRLIRALEAKGCKVMKATLTLPGVAFLPRLPKWEPAWLPGCCVQAIVVAATGIRTENHAEFSVLANGLGFTAPVVSHRSEL